ncbi:MAG TPA: hypothetical protein VJS88_05475, partial [Chthoniobacterales bacterium]|nr:hypothetical protein [Chthoniobacterales bacterium]
HIGAWMTLCSLLWNRSALAAGNLTVLAWACLIIVAGCLQTVAVRLKRIMAALRAKSATH